MATAPLYKGSFFLTIVRFYHLVYFYFYNTIGNQLIFVKNRKFMKPISLCENCRYYRRYYIIEKSQYKYVHYGYCGHHYMTTRERKLIPYIAECESWEQELQAVERREPIKKVLRDMRKQLADIAEILKDDEI